MRLIILTLLVSCQTPCAQLTLEQQYLANAASRCRELYGKPLKRAERTGPNDWRILCGE